jgi:hypothetical protein
MDAAPADRSFVAHLDVADIACDLGKERTGALEKIRRFDIVMGSERADHDLPVPLADRAEVADPADINHDLRLREPDLGLRHVVMPFQNFI